MRSRIRRSSDNGELDGRRRTARGASGIALRVKDFVCLSSQELERLVLAIETSLEVKKRFQFYLWAQGALQSFLPHELLICAHGDLNARRLRFETFSRSVGDEKLVSMLTEAGDGLVQRIIQDWQAHERAPRLYATGCARANGEAALLGELDRHGLGRAAAHGCKEAKGDFGSFFVFLRMPVEVAQRLSYLLELLMPYLHVAFYRMLDHESEDRANVIDGEVPLSAREIEVLQLVRDGRTNQEIGHILNISPLTAKNHVQRILRKLNVSNRTQAAAKGAAASLSAWPNVSC